MMIQFLVDFRGAEGESSKGKLPRKREAGCFNAFSAISGMRESEIYRSTTLGVPCVGYCALVAGNGCETQLMWKFGR